MTTEWKPRPRDLVIGGIPWVARMSDKARAKAAGSIGEYIYPCPIDRRVLQEIGLSADEFLRIAVEADADGELLRRVREAWRPPAQ